MNAFPSILAAPLSLAVAVLAALTLRSVYARGGSRLRIIMVACVVGVLGIAAIIVAAG
jgi:hypothetical protein